MRRDRLLKLADYLENVVAKMPPEAWDMEVWARKFEAPCMTACCALGHACSIPEFAAAGLLRQVGWMGSVCYGNKDGCEAAEEFFEIDDDTSVRLFDPVSYDDVTAYVETDSDESRVENRAVEVADVVRRIRELCEEETGA